MKSLNIHHMVHYNGFLAHERGLHHSSDKLQLFELTMFANELSKANVNRRLWEKSNKCANPCYTKWAKENL